MGAVCSDASPYTPAGPRSDVFDTLHSHECHRKTETSCLVRVYWMSSRLRACALTLHRVQTAAGPFGFAPPPAFSTGSQSLQHPSFITQHLIIHLRYLHVEHPFSRTQFPRPCGSVSIQGCWPFHGNARRTACAMPPVCQSRCKTHSAVAPAFRSCAGHARACRVDCSVTVYTAS